MQCSPPKRSYWGVVAGSKTMICLFIFTADFIEINSIYKNRSKFHIALLYFFANGQSDPVYVTCVCEMEHVMNT